MFNACFIKYTISLLYLCAVTLAFSSLANASNISKLSDTARTDYSAIRAEVTLQSSLITQLKSAGIVPTGMELSQTSVITGLTGDQHVRYRKYINGYPVMGTSIIAHIDKTGFLSEITDRDLDITGLTSTTTITSALAKNFALASAYAEGLRNFSYPTTPFLCYVYNSSDEKLYFSYKVELSATNGSMPSRRVYYVNATTGKIVLYYETIYNALDRLIFNANSSTKLSLGRTEGQAAVANAAVNKAYDSFGKIYNYFYNNYGRDSFSNVGNKLNVVVNYGIALDNAYWYPATNTFTFGTGSKYGNWINGYDICAHEYFHAITTNTSNLTYSGQSGALNESLSDIFAATLESADDGAVSTNTWIIGEDIGASLRRLDKPSSVTGQSYNYPDYMSEYLNITADNGGVHFNSSIPNHAFYLLSQGGKQATGNSTINVHGIGIDTASDIFYDANLCYFDESCTLEDAAYATTRSALKFGRRETSSTIAAWYAVGVISTTWGANNEGWQLTQLGWTYFDANGYVYSYDFEWAWWSNYDTSNGGVYMWVSTPAKWVWTSAEAYPWYYDYASGSWLENTDGTFE